jgi:hypothetical protein
MQVLFCRLCTARIDLYRNLIDMFSFCVDNSSTLPKMVVNHSLLNNPLEDESYIREGYLSSSHEREDL